MLLPKLQLTSDATKSSSQRKRDSKKARYDATNARRAENQYGIQLRKIARHIGDMVKAFNMRDPKQVAQLKKMLEQYAKTLTPWARSVAKRMIADVAARDAKMWFAHARKMGRALQQEIKDSPTGALQQKLMQEQVALITSLPIEAAERVHKLTLKQLPEGGRGESIIADIMKTGHVTLSRATLIARTETARTGSLLTQARAMHVGSEGYIWRTMLDSDVRHRHRKFEGRFFRWDSPPVSGEKGERAHAGCIYNCRCYAEVVLPDEPDERPAPANTPASVKKAALVEEADANDQVEALRRQQQNLQKSKQLYLVPQASAALQKALAEYHKMHDANVAAGYHE